MINSVNRGLRWIEAQVLSWSILLMAMLSIANVISRNLFQSSLVYAEEVSHLLVVLVTFLGTSYAARVGTHIRMAAVYDSMDVRGRKIMMCIVTLVTALIMLRLSWLGYEYVGNMYRMNRLSPALQVPMYLFYIWVPLGFFLTGLQYLTTFYLNISRKEVYISPELIDDTFTKTGEEK